MSEKSQVNRFRKYNPRIERRFRHVVEQPMYNEKLAMAILERLNEHFPDVMQFKNLYDFLLPQFPDVPQQQWMKSLNALLQTDMIKGVPLRDGSSLADLANITISPRGRDELRKHEAIRRQAFLQRLYDIVDGREGPTISRIQFLQVGSQLGLSEDGVDKMIHDFLSEGVIRGKPASEAVAFTHKGLDEVEHRMESNAGKEAVNPPTSTATTGGTDDRKFARIAIAEARKSVPEDNRVHPRVGVVVVKDGRILASAHRGEIPQCHAECIALEKKLADESLSGATVYTTLEPCTARKHPKIPCAIRLTERKVARVVIGMLDPDDRISGRGQRALRKAGIATEFFDHDLMTEIEELNRDFIREREQRILTSDEQNASRVPISTQNKAGRQMSDARRELEKASGLEVKEVTLKALYMNAETDSQTFKCSSVVELPPEYEDDSAADGGIMRSIFEPPTILIRGIDASTVNALAWKPNRLEFKDARTGEVKEYVGELRASMEPNTTKFAICS